MGKFNLNKLPEEERIRLIAEFYDAMSCLKNRDEARLFFRDLLSPDEIAMLIRRIEVALLLRAGFGYREISKTMGVGMDKITNVQKSLQRHGGGYHLITQRLRKILKNREKKQKEIEKRNTAAFPSFDYFKKKHPIYFSLFNLVDELNDWLDDDGKLKIERKADLHKKVKKNNP